MLDGRTALVTGAGSGIGRVTARTFLDAGWKVGLIGRREDALRETAGDSAALVLPCDVCDADAVDAAFDRCRAEWGRLDVLFNNAGANVPSISFEDVTYEQWSDVVAVNLTGMFLCARAAFRQMRTQDPMGGRIINNGSIAAYAPRPMSAPYAATKHAITGLTRATALDGRPFDIACGQIDIGNAATPMTRRMSTGVPQANGTMAAEPTMDVEEVARSVVFMAGMPLDANVQFMTVMATGMPYVGRG